VKRTPSDTRDLAAVQHMYAWTMLIISFATSNPEKNWYPVNVISIGFRSRNEIPDENGCRSFLKLHTLENYKTLNLL
jgi:hypothetical protein